MSTESKVAAPVGGVLAVLRAYDRQHGEPEDFGAAIAAVADLVEAINEYRATATAARAALPGRIELTMKAHESATDRLDAALAPFQTGGAA